MNGRLRDVPVGKPSVRELKTILILKLFFDRFKVKEPESLFHLSSINFELPFLICT